MDNIEGIFDDVIRVNEWNSKDIICAYPDDGGDSITYSNGKLHWSVGDDV